MKFSKVGLKIRGHAYFIIHSQIMFQGVCNILTHQEMWDGVCFPIPSLVHMILIFLGLFVCLFSTVVSKNRAILI